MVRLLRAGFMLALFASLFAATSWTQHTIRLIHMTFLRLLGCQVRAEPLVTHVFAQSLAVLPIAMLRSVVLHLA